jgi:hypothetical protein
MQICYSVLPDSSVIVTEHLRFLFLFLLFLYFVEKILNF